MTIFSIKIIKRYSILIAIAIGVFLLLWATYYYPGGTELDIGSKGYDMSNNYISNLLRPLAVNGMDNTARPFARGCCSCPQ